MLRFLISQFKQEGPFAMIPTESTWLANWLPLAVFWIMPFVPPSTTIQLKPLIFKQPLLLSQYGRLSIAFASKYMVIGALEVPLLCAVNSVAMVPQRFTVVPGPI